MLSIRISMSVVKDVDLEAMPSSIFVNDDDDELMMMSKNELWFKQRLFRVSLYIRLMTSRGRSHFRRSVYCFQCFIVVYYLLYLVNTF